MSTTTNNNFVAVFPSAGCIAPHANASAKGQVPWRCAHCGSAAFAHKCAACGRARDAAALRVFVGQLCREGAAEMVAAMLAELCPKLTAPALHIEPHTQAATGRGKGCAWVYVNDLSDIGYIVRCLNKRTYVMVSSATGEVGFRTFAHEFSDEDVHQFFLEEFTAELSHEVQMLLHRSPVTAEVPKSLADKVHGMRAGAGAPAPAAAAAAAVASYAAPAPFALPYQQPQQYVQPRVTFFNAPQPFVPTPMPPVIGVPVLKKPQTQMQPSRSAAAAAASSLTSAFLGQVAPSSDFAYQHQDAPAAPATPATPATRASDDSAADAKPFKRFRWNPYTGARVRA